MKSLSAATVTIGVVAIILGLVAAYVVKQSLQEEEVVAADNRVSVAVARFNLPKHTRITASHLQRMMIDPAQVPPGAVASPNSLLNRITRTNVEAGKFVLGEELYEIDQEPGIAELLRPGYRALPIQVSGLNLGATHFQPGALVDINVTFEDSHPSVGGVATKTLLNKVRVLAKGPVSSGRGRGNPTANSVTVEVTPEQANTLITAQEAGSLSLTLCAEEEEAQVAALGEGEYLATRRALLGLPEEVVPPAPPVFQVERWSGGNREVLEFTADRIEEAQQAAAADAGDDQPVDHLEDQAALAAPIQR